MQAEDPKHEVRAGEIDEELLDVLTAISIVAKRLARKLAVILRQRKEDEQDERTVTTGR